jgi:cytochrome d ubiquinol oxidase subunit II
MQLNSLWFILIAVLYVGYFVLDGFDLGVGMLLPFLGKNDTQRRVILNTIGPHWDGNEVWLVTAGGATFAAFPNWYATLFSGFYLPLFLMLVGLILRGVALEFRSKDDHPLWRKTWDWAACIGSFLPALLWGVAFSNFIRGVPIDASQNYVGGFWNLLNPYALLGGLASFLILLLHGAIYLTLKTEGELEERASKTAGRVWLVALVVVVAYIIFTYLEVDVVNQLGINPGIAPIGAVLSLLVVGWFNRQKKSGWAFTFTSLLIVLAMATIFLELYPNVLVSSLDPAWNLTIDNTASTPYTLRVMTIVAVVFVPVVVAYQVWAYRVFRKRVSEKGRLEY